MMNERYFRRAGLLVLFGTVTSFCLTAQTPFSLALARANQYKGAPNSEVLGKITEANVSMFHGMPSVQLPLFTVQGNNLSYNLALNYYTGGVKVNEKPTWVGLGWSLEGEAQITRKVNHIPDEQYVTSFYPLGQGIVPDKGYYFTSTQLNTPNWLNADFLNDAVNSKLSDNVSTLNRVIMDGEPDEFVFNFAGYSGSFYRTETGTWAVKSRQNLDIKIEEELHTFGYNQTSRYFFQVDPNNTDPYKIPQITSLFTKFTLSTPDGYKYIFGSVENAIEFTKTPIPYSNDIPQNEYPKNESEYYTANAWKLTKILAPDGEEINFTYERGKLIYERDRSYAEGVRYGGSGGNLYPARLHYTLSASFPSYLKTIETQNSILSFVRSAAIEKNYKRLKPLQLGTYLAPYSLAAGVIDGHGTVCNTEFYLARLIWGVGKGLNYAQTAVASSEHHFRQFSQQLDSVKLFDKSSQQYVSGVKLVYSADANIRRTLNEIYQFNFINNEQAGKYSFQYDDVAGMKSYESRSRDAWGYLADEQDELQQNGTYGPIDVFEMSFVGGAEPNYFSAFSTKGMLKKIINPLGGSTEFVYEANTYSSKVKANLATHAMDLNTLGANKTGSGSRVAQIIRKDYFGAPELVTKYDYSLTYPNNGLSSGILNADLIFDEVKAYNCANNSSELIIFEYGTHMFNEQIDLFKGGIVNYSQVTEILPDGSYTINKYSNNDAPQFRDELHAEYVNQNIIEQKSFRLSALDLERGNLLNSRMFDANNRLLKEVSNIYKNDPNRKNNFIKAMAHKTTQAGGQNYIAIGCNGGGNSNKKRLWAYKIYTYKNPLSKTIEKTYSEDGTVAFTQEKNFDYDTYGNLVLATETTSDGKILSKATRYNSHPDYSATIVSGQTALGLKNLNSLGIKNYPVEQLVYTNQQVVPPNTVDVPRFIAGTAYTYKSDKPLLDKEYAFELSAPIEGRYHATAAPNGIKNSKINGSGVWEQDSRLILQKSYPDYTAQAFANKPKTIVAKETNETVLWDHSGKYPVASFQNAIAEEVAYTGFEGDYSGTNAEFKNGWQFNGTSFQTAGAKIGKGALLVTPTSSQTVSNSFINSTIALQSGRKYRLSFWAASGSGIIYYRVYNGQFTAILPAITSASGLSYFETEFTAQGTGNIGLLCYRSVPVAAVQVDEIALYPAGTLFKSMSYDPATSQILSVTDGGGKLERYEYDAFGRLLKVRDQNGNLLTEHEYKIQNPF